MSLGRAVVGGHKLQPSVNNIIQIQNATFWRQHPSSARNPESQGTNNALFSGLNFALSALPLIRDYHNVEDQQHWAILSGYGSTAFLDVLRGRHIALPPEARSYPYLSSKAIKAKGQGLSSPARAIRFVGFSSDKDKASGSINQASYISARYESRREETDWSLSQYLMGETELNPSLKVSRVAVKPDELLSQIKRDLRLSHLLSMPVNNLSNGQKRRAKIAKALLDRPEVLLVDDPFMGLDPPTHVSLSTILRDLAYKSSPRLIMSLRPQDSIPDWITHLAVLGSNFSLALSGRREPVLFALNRWRHASLSSPALVSKMAHLLTESFGEPLKVAGHAITEHGLVTYRTFDSIVESRKPTYVLPNGEMDPQYLNAADREFCKQVSREKSPDANDLLSLVCSLPEAFDLTPGSVTETVTDKPSGKDAEANKNHAADSLARHPKQEALIELNHVVVSYGSKVVLGHGTQPGFKKAGLNLIIRQGSRLALLGANGSGKTTLLSLLTSDHPQSYSLPIKYFGRSRLPKVGHPGLSLWDIQSRIGHSSPEIHSLFPRGLTIRRCLENAWADTFSGPPQLTAKSNSLVDAFLRWWEPQLNPSFRPSKFSPHGNLKWASSSDNTFGTLPFQSQRLILLLRAIIKSPDIIILDEGFSGFSPEVRDKAMLFLGEGERMTSTTPQFGEKGLSRKSHPENGEAEDDLEAKNYREHRFTGLKRNQALIVVSHVREEIPDIVTEYIRLPGEEEVSEHGRTVEVGSCGEGDIRTWDGWNKIWGMTPS